MRNGFLVRVALMISFPWLSTFQLVANTSLDPSTVTVMLEKKQISTGEPVLIDFKIHAPNSSSVDFDLGYDNENLELKVVDPDGRIFTRPHVARQEGIKFSEAVHVESGKESVFLF